MFQGGVARHETSYAGGSATVAPMRVQALALAERQYPRSYPGEPVRDGLAFNPLRLSAGFNRAVLDPDGRVGASFTLGLLAAGVDATLRIVGPTYLTGVLSAGGAQVYLQNRVYFRRRIGVAVGLGYRRDSLTYDGPKQYGFTRLKVDSYGLRGVVFHRTNETYGTQSLRVASYVGYLPAFGTTIVGFSVAVGLSKVGR